MKSLRTIFVCLLGSCSLGELPKAGTKLVSPFSVATSVNSGQKNLYVLDAAAFGEYSSGSLLTYAISDDGSLNLQNTLDVPNYGTQVATSTDGQLLATATVGTNARIRLYKLQNGIPSLISETDKSDAASYSSLFFFTHSNKTYLSVAENGNSVGGKTRVWEVADGVLKSVFVLPDDLDRVAGAASELGYSNATFDGTRFIVFPSSPASSLVGITAAPKDFSISTWDGAGDPRAFSAAVVNFDKLANTLNRAIAFVPIVFQIGETEDSKGYRTYIAASLTSSNCAAGSVFVADAASEWIFKTSNWSSISNSQYESTSLKEKLSTILIEKYSNAGDVVAPQVEFATNVLKMGFVDSGASCKPFWLRSEIRTRGEGNARSWIQWQDSTDVTKPSAKEFLSFRGVMSVDMANNFLFGASFSRSSIVKMYYSNGVFEER